MFIGRSLSTASMGSIRQPGMPSSNAPPQISKIITPKSLPSSNTSSPRRGVVGATNRRANYVDDRLDAGDADARAPP